jgi:hypothetical protein
MKIRLKKLLKRVTDLFKKDSPEVDSLKYMFNLNNK